MIQAAVAQLGHFSTWFDLTLKALAVLIGGVWTYWNFRKTRTYAPKFELQLLGSVFHRDGVCVEVTARVKNISAAKHQIGPRIGICRLYKICGHPPGSLEERLREPLSLTYLTFADMFRKQSKIESGETITDRFTWKFPSVEDFSEVIWLKAEMNVFYGKEDREIQWTETCLIKVQPDE